MHGDLSVRPIIESFVAEVSGAALHDAATTAVLNRLWATYPVLVFPDLPLDPPALAAFARRFGDFGHDPFVRSTGGHANVIEVRRTADETTPIFGATWHSDWSFAACPPSGTLLHAQIVPPTGGETWFADCSRAYAALPATTRVALDGRFAVHSAAPAYGPRGLFARDDASRSMHIVVSPEAERRQRHPMVRLHPQSGRHSLFINHVYTIAVEEMDVRDGRLLLERLFRHMTAPEFVYRHCWKPDMLVLWDNRAVVHYAAGGYDGFERVMHRVTLAGEQPLAAPLNPGGPDEYDACRDHR